MQGKFMSCKDGSASRRTCKGRRGRGRRREDRGKTKRRGNTRERERERTEEEGTLTSERTKHSNGRERRRLSFFGRVRTFHTQTRHTCAQCVSCPCLHLRDLKGSTAVPVVSPCTTLAHWLRRLFSCITASGLGSTSITS